jgi:hypothetical protein
MEVHLTAETEKKLKDLAAQSGRSDWREDRSMTFQVSRILGLTC